MIDFNLMQKALLAGSGIALIAGPLGSILVWRRMAYFGDTLAHSALLGASLALLLKINLHVGLLSICLLVASLLTVFSKQKYFANDTILGIISHSTLAFGLIVAYSLKGTNFNILSLLYGDILSVNNYDLIWVYGIDIIALSIIVILWKGILSFTVSKELAFVEGYKVNLINWALILCMALVFAISMQLVGVLLITALLIIPASSARAFSKTPMQMAVLASIIGIFSVILGIFASINFDWPTGPCIVVISSIFFIFSILYQKITC